MLTRILHHSDKLCEFLDQLDIELRQPQRRHILAMAVRFLVRFPPLNQVCLPPKVACPLWPQEQPQTRRQAPRQPRSGAQAPVVHAGRRDLCGRGRTN